MDGNSNGAFTIRAWCKHRGLCVATYYNRRSEMPATIKIGRRRIITAEADQEWRRRMEQLGGRHDAGDN